MSRKKMKNLQFAVIGLGIFGTELVKTLANKGCEVLAIDADANRIAEVSDYATHCVNADATDERVLEQIGLSSFDNVIIGIGRNIQASIMCTLLCKEMGAKNITAKAINDNHAAILTKLGVDRVIVPEADSAAKTATMIAYPQMSDMIELTDDLAIVEIDMPASWNDKSIAELRIREKYGVTVIFILHDEGNVTPLGTTVCHAGSTVVLGGPMDKLETLMSRLGSK
ncbi:MAG: TrkA family potassium uptake protein [Clostridia bacterium]|nr:TrkA family potassium uptake protein [Clostridia bacterium]